MPKKLPSGNIKPYKAGAGLARDITYYWGPHHLMIDLGRRLEPRVRILFWSELFLTSGMASIFLIQSFPLTRQWTNWVTGFGAALLYLIAAWRFLSRMSYRER